MNDKKISFVPFHAINEFMTDEFRAEVIRSVLMALSSLPKEFSAPIDSLTRKLISLPGFRNSAKAPVQLKLKPMVGSFEKNPELVAAILAAWCETRLDFRQQVQDLLLSQGWEILPPEVDRTGLPGFIPNWPPGQDFDYLTHQFIERFPESQVESNDISLMAVWLSQRLPYHNTTQEEAIEE